MTTDTKSQWQQLLALGEDAQMAFNDPPGAAGPNTLERLEWYVEAVEGRAPSHPAWLAEPVGADCREYLFRLAHLARRELGRLPTTALVAEWYNVQLERILGPVADEPSYHDGAQAAAAEVGIDWTRVPPGGSGYTDFTQPKATPSDCNKCGARDLQIVTYEGQSSGYDVQVEVHCRNCGERVRGRMLQGGESVLLRNQAKDLAIDAWNALAIQFPPAAYTTEVRAGQHLGAPNPAQVFADGKHPLHTQDQVRMIVANERIKWESKQ